MTGGAWSSCETFFSSNKKYYSEYLTSAEKISTNMLASRLQKPEAEGLISRSQDPQNLSKFIYQPTEKGKDLLPLLLDIIEWSVKYNPQQCVADNIINGAPSNLPEGFIRIVSHYLTRY